MSRFKFRIWDKKNGRWFHGDPSDKARELGVDSIDLLGEVITVGDILRDKNDGKMINLERLNDLVVLQSTGLRDIDGKEIFEGDILKIVGNEYDNPELERSIK